mgnify:CR=1 FL=1
MNVYIQSKTSIYSLPYDSQILLHTGYEKIYVKIHIWLSSETSFQSLIKILDSLVNSVKPHYQRDCRFSQLFWP